MSGNFKIKWYPCPCCGFLTRDEQELGTDRICPVCRWQDDYSEGTEPGYSGGPNHISLQEAQENFKKYGAKTFEKLKDCRPPLPEEYPELKILNSDQKEGDEE